MVTALRRLSALPDLDGGSLDGVLLSASQAYANFKASGAGGHAACERFRTPSQGLYCGVCMPSCPYCGELTFLQCPGTHLTGI